MGYYEHDNSESRALVIVNQSVRDSEVYRNARQHAVDCAIAEITSTPMDYDAMKNLGGFSAVIKRAIEGACAENPDTVKPRGSKMFPVTVQSILRQDALSIRREIIGPIAAIAQRRS